MAKETVCASIQTAHICNHSIPIHASFFALLTNPKPQT